MRTRWRPWTMICALPSGMRSARTTLATVPTRYSPFSSTMSTSPSFWATKTMSFGSWADAAFSAATDLSRPTPKGTTSRGNTTDSRRGTSGSVLGSCCSAPGWRASIVMVSPSRVLYGNGTARRRPGFRGGERRAARWSTGLCLDVRAGGLHLDLLRTRRLGLRELQREHAVLEGRFDLVRVDLRRQSEAPLQGAVEPLLEHPALLPHVAIWPELRSDGDGVRRRADVQVIGPDAGERRLEDEGVLGLVQVDRERRSAAISGLRADHTALEETVHGLAKRNEVARGVPAGDRHFSRRPPSSEFLGLGFGLPDQSIEKVLQRAELEDDLHASEIHATPASEVTDGAHAQDILLRVEADVRRRADRLQQSLLLVDAQRARVDAGEGRRDRDHG